MAGGRPNCFYLSTYVDRPAPYPTRYPSGRISTLRLVIASLTPILQWWARSLNPNRQMGVMFFVWHIDSQRLLPYYVWQIATFCESGGLIWQQQKRTTLASM